jgi:hypothetical protein
MRDIVQRLKYSDASRSCFVEVSNRSPQFLTDISQIVFQGRVVLRTHSELNFVTSNYLSFMLDVLPECTLNGGKDRLCVNRCPSRGADGMRASSSEGAESSQNYRVVCG